MLKSRALAIFAAPAALLATTPAFATGENYSSLTSAVDWSSAITAIMAVGALLAGVLVVRKGVRFVLGIIR